MSLKNLTTGDYEAKLTDWSMVMVEKISQPQIRLKFDFEHDGEIDTLTFSSFLYSKDGEVNKKTLKTLEVIEFSGQDVQDLNGSTNCVNNQKTYSLSIDKDRNGKYWQIDWVNDPSQKTAEAPKEQNAAAVKGFNFKQFNGALQGAKRSEPAKAKPAVKNHAPGAGTAANDNDSEFPF